MTSIPLRACTALFLATALSSTPRGARAKSLPPAVPIPDHTICVVADRRSAGDEAYLRGLRRPFLLKDLPLERNGYEAGALRNSFRLVACPRSAALDTVNALPGDPRWGGQLADYVVSVRIKGWSTMTIDYIAHPDQPLTEEQKIDPTGMTVEVAICPPDSTPSRWDAQKVWWREKPRSAERAQEIHGWMAGMAALQILYRRFGLPEDIELLFESRGRNR